MIPENNVGEVEFKDMPSKTYKIITERDIINGTCDELESVMQSVYLITNIERYENVIYSWAYGIETKDLFGKDPSFAILELENRIVEALSQDERIISVDSFSFSYDKGKVSGTYVVHSIFGDIEASKEVDISV